MKKHLQVVQLCLPRLSPKDACMLTCTCTAFKAMRFSWEAHEYLEFELDGSLSVICWLHKNIVSIRSLGLRLKFSPPKQLLQSLFAGSR